MNFRHVERVRVQRLVVRRIDEKEDRQNGSINSRLVRMQ